MKPSAPFHVSSLPVLLHNLTVPGAYIGVEQNLAFLYPQEIRIPWLLYRRCLERGFLDMSDGKGTITQAGRHAIAEHNLHSYFTQHYPNATDFFESLTRHCQIKAEDCRPCTDSET